MVFWYSAFLGFWAGLIAVSFWDLVRLHSIRDSRLDKDEEQSRLLARSICFFLIFVAYVFWDSLG